ncbi:unnamed protein product, partial [Brenthis ino]
MTKKIKTNELTIILALPAEEQSRQAVIRELIHTEAEYIKHLMAIVEVFIAAAHAIQDRGKMLGICTSKLFSNLPDLLNSSLHFWNLTFIPMIEDAVNCERPFDTDLMAHGFACFKQLLWAYEKFVVDQSKLLEYYRKCQNDAEFNVYLAWCHSQKECNRLQLNDFLVKPMQRLTKYGLILHRIANHTDSEYERSSVEAMETSAKNYVVELNRCVRQHEELEKIIELENMLIAYDMILKDEEVEKIDVRVFLLTDMLLVCRKLTKGNQFKLIRPKYMIDKLVQISKFDKHNRDLTGLAYIMVDDVGSSYASFILSETPKDPNPQLTLKTWENKVKEAKLTYELTVWVARNPNRDITRQEVDSNAEYTRTRHTTEEGTIEHEARERVATMVQQSMGASYDRNLSPLSLTTDSFDGSLSIYNKIVVGVSARPPIPGKKCNIVHRTSTVFSSGSTPRNSRLSSFQQSTSAHSHDEPQAGPSRLLHRASTSVEHHLPPVPDANEGSPSITVSDSETVSVQAPTLNPVPIKNADSRERSSSAHSTLRVQPQNNVATLIYSLPDLTIEPSTPRTISSPTQPTASERMYQSHQEILQRNRLMACQNQQYLSPDHRGSSYPPPSPTRASLKRGFAFSYTAKNPPLTKMGHVTSQSQMQLDAISTSSGKDEKTSPKAKSSTEKSDKKSKLTSTRRKKTEEEVKPDASPSRKEESPSRREVINDTFKRQGSSCSSYKDESPGTSFRDESPGASFRDESTSPSHKDESQEASYREGSPDQSISKSPSPRLKDDRSKPVVGPSIEKYSVPDQQPDSSGLEKSDTPDSNLRDDDEDLAGRRESKSSDSIQKEKSLSFSFKDESYDSSHREESFSLSHRDETPSSDRKETSSPTTRSVSVEPHGKEGSVKKQNDSLYSNESMQSPEILEDSNIKDSPDLSHKTEASSVICKEDNYKGTIDTINKYICLECGQACDEYRDQDEESIWNVWLCSEHANSSHKKGEAVLVPSYRCRFSSSSTSSIQTHEDLSSSTSKATDVDINIKYEVFSSSSSSVHAQEEPDERCQAVPSPTSPQTALEPGPSYEEREESTSSSSKDEKVF